MAVCVALFFVRINHTRPMSSKQDHSQLSATLKYSAGASSRRSERCHVKNSPPNCWARTSEASRSVQKRVSVELL